MPVRLALLTALPLLAVGLLAVYALESDYALLRARQSEAALEMLRGLGAAARAAVGRTADAAVRAVVGASKGGEGPRGLILGAGVRFATLHRDGRRLYPPEEPASLLVWETERLRDTAGAFATARANLAAAPRSWTWLPQPEGGALAHCRRGSGGLDVCVLLDAARLQTALAAAFDAQHADGVALVDPAGRRVWRRGTGRAQPAAEALSLGGPLRGWRAEASPDPKAAIGRPPALLLGAVVLPLLASWLLLAWQFHRTQQLRLADSRHRAGIAAQLSHELRTPLANLKLYAGLIQRRADEAAAVRGYCSVIEAEADRLSRLADNATAYARGESAERSGRTVAVPDAVASAIVARLHPLCAAAGCSLTLSGAAAAARRFDRAAVEQILTNLIDNARKYAAGGAIEVTTRIEPAGRGERLLLAVRDHGPGVPAPLRRRIFEPLARGEGEAPGFGLGLAAVRRLARAAGGDARVEDAGPGARFTVWVAVGTEEGACAC